MVVDSDELNQTYFDIYLVDNQIFEKNKHFWV